MDSQTSRKIIVAGGMAAVLVIGAVTFALLPHPSSVARISQPPATVAPAPTAPAPVASAPEAPAAIAQTPDASAAVAGNDSVGPTVRSTANRPVVEPKVKGNRRLAKAPTSADTPDRVVTPAEPTVDSSQKSAGATSAPSVDNVKSVGEVAPPSTDSGTSALAPATTEPAASDTASPPK